jgi:hypothetical protein
MDASALSPDAQFRIPDLTRQMDGDDCVIGRPETGTFVAIPAEALTILDLLAAGKTVGEVEGTLRETYGEAPDLTSFLKGLESRGLVEARSPTAAPGLEGTATSKPASGLKGQVPLRYHFTSIPVGFARLIFGPAGACFAALAFLAACAALITLPGLLPGRSSIYFAHDRALKTALLSVLGLSSLCVHEMGHLLAARAAGVKTRFGIGHRLWVVVAEADITGLWSVPKGRRYVPLLAGILLDVTSASLLILLLASIRLQWVNLPAFALEIARAFLFVYFLRMTWQCFFFVKTDLYFVLSTATGCKNLMGDTEAFLQNQLARILPAHRRGRIRPVDQSGIPAHEMRAVRLYSLVWLLGRLLALTLLFTVTLPVAAQYIVSISHTFSQGYSRAPYDFLDGIGWLAFSLVPLSAGLYLWLAGLVQRWRTV